MDFAKLDDLTVVGIRVVSFMFTSLVLFYLDFLKFCFMFFTSFVLFYV